MLCALLQMVIGCLSTSRSTGRLQLCDQTGSIDCVVGAWPSATSESSATNHCCGANDCMIIASSGRCPFVQTSLLDGVFRIDRFRLVVETFRLPNGQIMVTCPYIQFCAGDILQLCRRSQPNSSLLVSNRSSDSENGENRPKILDIGSTPRRQTMNDSCEDMFVDSPVLRAPMMTAVDTVDQCRCSVSQLFVVDHCENISLRSRHIEQLSLQFTATGYFVGPPKPSSCRHCCLSFFLAPVLDILRYFAGGSKICCLNGY